MINRIFTKTKSWIRPAMVLSVLFILLGISSSVSAQLVLNGTTSTPAGYFPGQTTTLELVVDIDDPSFAEWTDYIVLTFPVDWTVNANVDYEFPTGSVGCANPITNAAGTNVFSIGNTDGSGGYTGGSLCGSILPTSIPLTIDITVPAATTGDQTIDVNVIGDGGLSGISSDLNGIFTLSEVLCILTCPSDVVMDAEPGMCGANVMIDLPMISGTCAPNPTDMSGFYPVGTTEVVFDADAMGVIGGVSCTILVTVNDIELPTISGPNDEILSLEGGECEAIFNYLIEGDDDCGNAAVEITQSVDPELIIDAIACVGGSTTHSRVFDMESEGILTDVEITEIEIGVAQSFNAPAVTINIYELDGALQSSNMTLVSTNTTNLPDLLTELFSFPISATLLADKTYVIEVVTPGSVFSGFVMGTNASGETGTSYIQSNFCAIPEFTDLNTLGAGDQHLVMSLIGTQSSVNIEQIEGIPAGSAFPIGITTNEFVVTDVNGNTSSITFDVTVIEFPNPITSLACNNLVNVSLDTDCEGVITADMVLEGGPYGCYDTYTVVIKDEDDNEYGDVVTGDMVGLELTVEVTDPNGNICWGEILIEDKLGPQLECSTRTTQCTEDTDPGSPLAQTIRVNEYDPQNNAISTTELDVIDVEVLVEGLDKAVITDLNIDLDFTHSFVNDLAVSLISPQGTEVLVFIQPLCDGSDIIATFDDEAALPNVEFDSTCVFDGGPTIVGEFQSLDPLSAFDGEDPNGTWIVRISDFFAGDGGQLNSVVLEISQSGGIVGLPIPDDAIYQAAGNNAFLVTGLDPCGPAILSYEDEVINMDCTSPYTQVIYRTYTATDESGNDAISCVDTINVERTDLGSLELPRNYDDLDLPALSCTAGYPTPAVTGGPTGTFCENVQFDYEDITIDICEGSYKILRYWNIFEWCTSEVIEYTQIIKVVDKEGPSISCSPLGYDVSTSPSDCEASLLIPVPSISDNCTAAPTYTVTVSGGTLIQQGVNYSLEDLTIGTYTVTYTASDNCGNTSTCDFEFEVVDDISPVAVCDQHTTVSLSFDETVLVYAETFDDGSYDECTDIVWAARRMTDACGIAGNTTFGPEVTFCCSDVGETVMVEFRVTDEYGNSNTCMVEVEVDDKIAPAIQVPDNVTLNCHDDYTDLNMTGGMAIGFDNCEVEPATYQDFPSIGSCGSGQVARIWTVKDKGGLIATGTQTIFLVNNTPFDIGNITFPTNKTLTSCEASTDPSATGEPIINDDICSQVSYTYWDDEFTIVEDACLQIYRKWTVIDQCQYNPAIPNIGIWEDIQVIEIINNNAPVFTEGCSNVTIDAFGSCEGEVALAVTAEDDCTPAEKLTYTWKIDAFNTNDGIFEFENTGNSLSGTYPVGTHRIFWTVSDNCGNIESCSYLFTVRDAKAPTPYCISSLSTAVMNTDGTVEIWASDFDLGATDNCTAPANLVVSFTENGFTPARQFSCADIPSGVSALIEDIQIWVTDEAGNKDHCTVSLLVEDNEANFCDDSGTITVAGNIVTPDNEAIKGVDVYFENEIGEKGSAPANEDGTYSFDLIPNMDYTVTAEKDLDVLNGITTLDIVFIQKHILTIQLFDSPYQTIAADANNSGNVNGADIIAVRKLLLGYTEEFPNDQKSWRFVDSKQEFPNSYDVFPYVESLDIDFTNGSAVGKDLYGVKIGDVNGSANPENFTSNLTTRSDDDLQFVIDNQSYEAGQTIEIPVFASNFDRMIGYQMSLEFDMTAIDVVDVKAGALNITTADVNMTRMQEGVITSLWASVDPITTQEALFTIVVTAKQAGDLQDVFHTSHRITETLAYNSSLEEQGVEIAVREDEEILPVSEAFVLYQNTPNPFNGQTNIAFDLPTTDKVMIQVYDMNGIMIMSKTDAFAAGYNNITITDEMLPASGVYYYTISTTTASESGRMILID